MRLSVLDLVPVRSDQSTSDALAASTLLAQTADRLGYTRYWVAEHHNMPSVAATSPPVLIAHLAAHTAALRLGSGGVMLPNHAPLAVAEQFALLEAAAPRAHRPRHRARARLGPGDLAGAARCGRPRRPRHRGVPRVSRRRRRADEQQRRAGAAATRPHAGQLHPQGHARRGHRARGCGCWVRRCTPRGWPPPRACRTCSPTTSPVRAPRRRCGSTARTSGPAT